MNTCSQERGPHAFSNKSELLAAEAGYKTSKGPLLKEDRKLRLHRRWSPDPQRFEIPDFVILTVVIFRPKRARNRHF